MGFDVEYWADIQKFPTPLYTKYKYKMWHGVRIEVPAGFGDTEIELMQGLLWDQYDIVGITVAVQNWHLDEVDKDKTCSWSLYIDRDLLYNDIPFLDKYYNRVLMPTKRVSWDENAVDGVRFVYHNTDGEANVLHVDVSLSKRTPDESWRKRCRKILCYRRFGWLIGGAATGGRALRPRKYDKTKIRRLPKWLGKQAVCLLPGCLAKVEEMSEYGIPCFIDFPTSYPQYTGIGPISHIGQITPIALPATPSTTTDLIITYYGDTNIQDGQVRKPAQFTAFLVGPDLDMDISLNCTWAISPQNPAFVTTLPRELNTGKYLVFDPDTYDLTAEYEYDNIVYTSTVNWKVA